MKKILFLHGFFATGSCPMARALREAFDGQAIVLTPDLPLHPKEALKYIRILIDKEKPDLLIGNSCGAFLAQMLSPVVGIPALLGNPHFKMTDFLSGRIGEHEYKAPRMDGNQKIIINETLINEFGELEATQFDCCNPYYKDRVWGLFGEQDTLAHFEPLFLQHYNNSYHFPGGHTPTELEVKTWYAPLAQKMIMEVTANQPMKHREQKPNLFGLCHGEKTKGEPNDSVTVSLLDVAYLRCRIDIMWYLVSEAGMGDWLDSICWDGKHNIMYHLRPEICTYDRSNEKYRRKLWQYYGKRNSIKRSEH